VVLAALCFALSMRQRQPATGAHPFGIVGVDRRSVGSEGVEQSGSQGNRGAHQRSLARQHHRADQ
jgi:hypothetical protein